MYAQHFWYTSNRFVFDRFIIEVKRCPFCPWQILHEASFIQVSPLRATGLLPFGADWPFNVGEKEEVLHDAYYSDDEDDDTMQERSMDEDRRHLLWDIILGNVTDDASTCMNATLELSDPTIFMMLGIDTKLVNDLIFLDYLTNDNMPLIYMGQILQQLAGNKKQETCGQHMQLPGGIENEAYWKDFKSFAEQCW